MYWTFGYQGQRYASWGEPRRLPEEQVSDLKPRFDVQVYRGEEIGRNDSICFLMQGDATLGLGDTIWLITYMRDIYRLKARRHCKRFVFVSSPWILNFYSHFLPDFFELKEEYMTEKEFATINHKLPAMYYWHDTNDNADRSWVDNQSLVQRLYGWSGIEYQGIPDWGEFTDEKLLYPQDSFWTDLGLNKNDPYVFFQWHSSGHTKNLPPKTNIKLLRHITQKYGLKVYVVGRLNSLDPFLSQIPGVVNLSGKTEGHAEALFSLAFNSEFIVSPDSAGVHMAEAYRIPAVCIMATLPPVYICSKYQIPTFMYGSGHCPYCPCGVVHHLPKGRKCPPDTGDYCKVLEDIDLDLFDRCLQESFDKRKRYRWAPAKDFYKALKAPISLA
jgi:hypothetical protein